MASTVRFLATAAALGAVAIVASGCAADEELPDLFAVNTAVSVTPGQFLLGVPCTPGAGAMQSYVAVVTDRGPVDEDGNTPVGYGFELPASAPTPCTQTVAFRRVVVGHRYEARVHGYALPASALVPTTVGADGCLTETIEDSAGTDPDIIKLVPAPGSTYLCTTGADGQSFEPVQPSWQRSCGTQGYGSAVARPSVELPITGCVSEGENGNVGVGETSIVVDPTSALSGGLSCLPDAPEDPGYEADHVPTANEIDAFDVLPVDPGLPETVGVDCGATAAYTEVEPGTSYAFRVEAGNADFPARWATNCTATAFEGVTVTTSCDSLTDRGTLRLDLTECPEGATYHLRATNADTGAEQSFGDGHCPGPALVSGIAAGRWDVVATIDVPEVESVVLSCTATVVAAATSDVECTENPLPGD